MMLSMIQQGLNSRLHEAPRARVQRLLLTPDDSLGVGVLIEVFAELSPRERVQLLDAGYGDVFAAGGFAMFDEGGIDLAGAEDNSVNGGVGVDGTGFVGGIGDDPLEVRFAGEVDEVGTG